MCFNKEVSITTYGIGTIGALYLWKHNPALSIFYAWVALMQLIEFFLWNNQNCSDPQINSNNRNISDIGILINHMEPFILWIAITGFSKTSLSTDTNIWMIIFCLFTVLYYIGLHPTECTTVTKESAPHLYWKWNEGPNYPIYYLGFLFSLIILSLDGLDKNISTINAGIVVGGFLLSSAIYGDTHSTGAIWCFIAAFAPWILNGYYSYIEK